jgi:hypothetical protein
MDSNRTKGCVTFILVLAVILAIAAAAVAYYFYSIGDLELPGSSQTKQNCGCFYTSTDGSCTAPTSALIFNPGTVDANGKCVASCPTPSNDPSLSGLTCEYKGKPSNGSCTAQCGAGFESKTVSGPSSSGDVCLCCKTEELKSCNQINLKENLACTNLAVTTDDEKILIPPFDPNIPLKLTATFSNKITYTGFVFKVNGTEVNPDEPIPGDCTSNCTIDDSGMHPYVMINPQDYLSDSSVSLQITVDGLVSSSIKNLDTTPCTRSYLLKTNDVPSCNSVSLVTTESSGKFNVSGASLRVSSLPTSLTNLKTKFTFSPIQAGVTTLTTKDSAPYLDSNDLVMDQSVLNSAATFVENKAFPVLDPSTSIQVDLVYSIDGAVATLSCGNYKVDNTSTGNGNGTGNGGTDNGGGTVDNGNGAPTGAVSDFTVSKSGPQCVDRTSPTNVAVFTIRVTNRNTNPDLLEAITDKLPLGFVYQAGSTRINNVVRADNEVVSIVTTGNSQEITWKQSDGWSFAGGETMTINLTAVAGSPTVTGQNMNEVVIKPINTPTNAENLRTSYTFDVAQTCGTPNTGLFDDTSTKVIAGIAVLIIGFLFSITATGEKLSLKIANSTAISRMVNNFNEIKAELFVPKYSFEKKVLSGEKKKKRNKN